MTSMLPLSVKEEIKENMKSASVCIVDKDITKGFSQDTKSYLIANCFYSVGISVRKIVISNGVKEDLVLEFGEMLKSNDLIIISMGADRCQWLSVYEALADVFQLNLEYNSELTDLFKEDNCPNGRILLPETATVMKSTSSEVYPIIRVRNVYLFLGDGKKLRSCLRFFQKHFYSITKEIVYNRYIYVNCNQSQAIDLINKAAVLFKNVNVFYRMCQTHNDMHKFILESIHLSDILGCEKYLKEQIASLSIKAECVCCLNSVYKFVDQSNVFAEALQVLEKCFTDYKLDEIFLSFNGGKDCTVLLYLTMAVLNRICSKNNEPIPKIQCIYIRSNDTFDEIKEFIQETMENCSLSLMTFDGNIKDTLETIIKVKPNYKAVLMGTRRSDPFSENLEHFKMTDPNWPQLMRVNPILNWTYSDVWYFLRELHIPYCSLYDYGYTSLGGKSNTHCNSALKVDGGHLPAYLLDDGSLERAGRYKENNTFSD